MRRNAVLCLATALLISCGGAPSQPAVATPPVTTVPSATVPAATSTPAPTAAATSTAVVVEMGDHFFDPAQLTVKVGTTVTWKVVGQSSHDIAARDGAFQDGAMTFGRTLSYTFTQVGRFPYVCMQHEGDGMVGVVTVID
jgi:plastocyanin